MTLLPRLALATPPDGREPAPASLAMLAGLNRVGWRVQHFRSRARPFGTASVHQITGLPGRHLDAWLMPPATCREVFARGCRQAEIALVEGALDDIHQRPDPFPFDRPGWLGPIREALDLPTLAMVPCPHLDRGVHLPAVPPEADAVLIDGLERREDFETIRHLVQLLIKKPVVGAVEALPGIRAALAGTPTDELLDEEIVDRLGASFLRFADLRAIRALRKAARSPSRTAGAGVTDAGSEWPTPRTRRSVAITRTRWRLSKHSVRNWSSSRRCVTRPYRKRWIWSSSVAGFQTATPTSLRRT